MLEFPQLLQTMAAAPTIAGVDVDPCTLGDLSKTVQEHLAAIWELSPLKIVYLGASSTMSVSPI